MAATINAGFKLFERRKGDFNGSEATTGTLIASYQPSREAVIDAACEKLKAKGIDAATFQAAIDAHITKYGASPYKRTRTNVKENWLMSYEMVSKKGKLVLSVKIEVTDAHIRAGDSSVDGNLVALAVAEKFPGFSVVATCRLIRVMRKGYGKAFNTPNSVSKRLNSIFSGTGSIDEIKPFTFKLTP